MLHALEILLRTQCLCREPQRMPRSTAAAPTTSFLLPAHL